MKDLIEKDDLVFDLIKRYPFLKEVFLKCSKKFEKLNNPLIFNTVAKVTTLEKAAKIGGIYIYDLLYELNSAIGKKEEFLKNFKQKIPVMQKEFIEKNSLIKEKEPPLWLKNEKEFDVIDVRDSNEEPFLRVFEKAKNLKKGEGFKLLQNFLPLPLMTYLESLGFESFFEKAKDGYIVYFFKAEGKNVE